MKRFLFCAARCFATLPSRPAIAFDIDGVLIREKNAIAGAREALHKITAKADGGSHAAGIPYCFLTNGGGNVEAYKARQLETLFDIKIDPKQICLSHTPMRSLVDKYKDSPVCVAGMLNVKEVAKHYGFEHVFTPGELKAHNLQRVPFCANDLDGSSSTPANASFPLERLDEVKVGAVMIFHDPRDWYSDLQVVLDILMDYHKSHPPTNTKSTDAQQHVPLYISNPDVQWSAGYHSPRLAQGAFTVCLRALFKEITGTELQYQSFGKPTKVQFKFAESLLHARAQELAVGVAHMYMIGDNPHADIKGANMAGPQWSSCFVRTGNIQLREHHLQDPLLQPTFAFDHVGKAIDFILNRHQAGST